jgi:hypothetical protein
MIRTLKLRLRREFCCLFDNDNCVWLIREYCGFVKFDLNFIRICIVL